LVEHYAFSSLYFYHFDFYRFSDPSEWESTGFAEYFRPDAVCVIEWPERVANWLPHIDLSLTLEHSPSGRTLRLAARSEAGSQCLAAYAVRLQ
jgi:tRNA threonylcarbamoyladenosine biosynthesis protein TsaE